MKRQKFLTRWSLRGAALGYLTLMLVVPLAAVVQDGFRDGLAAFWEQLRTPAAWHALKLTLWTAALMAVVNAVTGTMTAYVLTRYSFPGRGILNSIVDLPFAIPSLVTGVMLVLLYGPNGTIGGWLKDTLGLQIVFAPPGILLALLFISFPFVVRTVEPVLHELEADQEEAARTLGASPWKTFWKILFPALRPAIFTGMLLSFSRAVGEFGSVVMVAGNIPMRSQTAAVYVLGEIESENQRGASVMSVVLLAISFSIVVLVDYWQHRNKNVILSKAKDLGEVSFEHATKS